jgi:alkylation response protein AidB-like acyl-CoA dehydrogenase
MRHPTVEMMMTVPKLEFPPFRLPPQSEALRAKCASSSRDAAQHQDRGPLRDLDHASPEFSRRWARAAGSGITWPKKYGGSERSFLDRFVVTEELLGNGAPAGALGRRPPVGAAAAEVRQRGAARGDPAAHHAGRVLLQHRHERARLGLGPGVGAHARRAGAGDGFRVNGTKIWTSGAHRNHYCIALVRTSGQHGDRHKGLSQILVDLKTPGVTIRPIINLAGRHDWNEVTFTDAFIPRGLPDRQRRRRLEAGHQRARVRAFRPRTLPAELLCAAASSCACWGASRPSASPRSSAA